MEGPGGGGGGGNSGDAEDDDDSVNQIYDQQTMVAISIYSFMDRLLSAIRSGAEEEEDDEEDGADGEEGEQAADATNGGTSVAAASATVVTKPGGYSEESFFYLSEAEKEQFECRICFSILKDCHECRNRHRFCYGCIYEWSGQEGNGSDFCPVCRTAGEYARSPDVNERLGRKRVRCSDCNWRGCLRDLETHEHRRYEEKELAAAELPALPVKPALVAPPPPPSPPPPAPPQPPVEEPEGMPPSQQPQPSQPTQPPPPPPLPRLLSRRLQGSGPRLQQSQSSAAIRQPPPQLPPRLPTPPAQPSSGLRGSNSADSAPGSTTSTRRAPATQRLPPPPPPPPPPPLPPRVPHPPSAPRPANATARPLARRIQQPILPPQQPPQQPDASPTISEMPMLPPPPAFASTTPDAASIDSAPAPAPASSSSPALQQQPEMQYVRLNRRPRRQTPAMAQRLQQSRDHLAVLMALLTVELDERRRAVEQHQLETRERERRRLQQLAEVQSLNRRLSQVASNLSRIVDGGGGGGSGGGGGGGGVGVSVATSGQGSSGGGGAPLPHVPRRLGRSRAGLGPPIRPNSDTEDSDETEGGDL